MFVPSTAKNARTEQSADYSTSRERTHGTVENEPRENHVGALPVKVLQQGGGKGSEHEGTKAGATDGQSRG